MRKHSYSCRYHRVGRCLSGDACQFQHDDKAGIVHYMSDALGDAEVVNDEAPIQDEDDPVPPDKMIRPKRKTVVNIESLDDDD